jgi:hypothetical protein
VLLPPFVFVLNGEDWAETQTKKKNWGNWTEKEKKKTRAEPRRETRNQRKEQRKKNQGPARKNLKQRKNKRTTQEHTREPKQSFGRPSITPPSPESESKPGEQEEPENKKASPPADQISSSSSSLFILIHRLLFTLNFNSHILTHFLYSAHARLKSLHACFL